MCCAFARVVNNIQVAFNTYAVYFSMIVFILTPAFSIHYLLRPVVAYLFFCHRYFADQLVEVFIVISRVRSIGIQDITRLAIVCLNQIQYGRIRGLLSPSKR